MTTGGDTGAVAAAATGVSAAASTEGPMDSDDIGDDAELREVADSVTDEEVAEILESTIIVTDGATTV